MAGLLCPKPDVSQLCYSSEGKALKLGVKKYHKITPHSKLYTRASQERHKRVAALAWVRSSRELSRIQALTQENGGEVS